jgi:hypothetical protein
MGRPLGMKGSFFSTNLYGHHQVSNFNKSEHFSGSNKAFEILANLGVDPLVVLPEGLHFCPFEEGGLRREGEIR